MQYGDVGLFQSTDRRPCQHYTTHTHTKAVTNLWAVLVSRPDVYRIIPLDFLSLGLFVHSVTTSALTQVRERGGHLLAAGT